MDGVRDDPNSGKVALSLALSIDEQLTEYLRLVTTLEVNSHSLHNCITQFALKLQQIQQDCAFI